MLTLGITGGIGSGKSIISQLLRLMGVPVYISDEESKKLLATSPVLKEKLTQSFGEEIYKGGVLNKALFASYIFNDKEKLKLANSIIHPEVRNYFFKWLEQYKDCPVVANEAAILYESGLNLLLDKVVMIYAPVDVRVERVVRREGISRDKVMERINNQLSDEEKLHKADFVIYNDGSQSLILQTLNLLEKLTFHQ